MAAKETAVVNDIMKSVSPFGVRVWRNVRGMFFTRDGRPIKAGLLAYGSGDLIGFRPVVITPEMIGRTVAVFCCIEVKADTYASKEQKHYIQFVKENGGFAGIARSPEDALKILEISY